MEGVSKTVRIASRRTRLDVTLVAPEQPRCACVLLHGLSVDRDEYADFYVDLAEKLAFAGVASARFDFKGHGSRANKWKQLSVTSQVADTMSVMEWLRARYQLLPPRIGIVATSFSAPAAIYAAWIRPDIVNRLALISPVLDYDVTFLNPMTAWGLDNFGERNIARAHKTGVLMVDGEQRLPDALFDEMAILDPLRQLSSLDCRTLIVHGSQDSMVPIGPARAAAVFPQVDLVEISNMDHGPFHIDDETGESGASLRLRAEVIGLVEAFLSSP
jgi:pimeloyl-ACP methyl ester carboxylesterase